MPVCQSEWPLGLRRRSEVSLLLRLSARIPPGAWMSVSCECCVLSGRGLCDELITFPEESCQLWCVGVESSRMRRQWSSGTGRESNANIAQTMHRTKCHCRDLEHAVSRSDPECSGMFHLTVALPFSWDRPVGIVPKLRARRPSIDVQFPQGEREFSFFPKCQGQLWGTLIYLFSGSRGPSPRG